MLASTAGLRVFSFILLAGLLAPKARSSETVWKDQASSSQISSRDNSHGIYSAFESSQTGVELLTHAGSRIKTVLFAAMVGGVCTSDDWRGDLPRYLMKFLPEARGDMIYARFLGQPQLGHDPFCQACTANGTDEGIAGMASLWVINDVPSPCMFTSWPGSGHPG